MLNEALTSPVKKSGSTEMNRNPWTWRLRRLNYDEIFNPFSTFLNQYEGGVLLFGIEESRSLSVHRISNRKSPNNGNRYTRFFTPVSTSVKSTEKWFFTRKSRAPKSSEESNAWCVLLISIDLPHFESGLRWIWESWGCYQIRFSIRYTSQNISLRSKDMLEHRGSNERFRDP